MTEETEVREGIIKVNSNLEKCIECGKVAVQIVHHDCAESADHSYTRLEERREWVAEDTKDSDDEVLILNSSVSGNAYHEIHPESGKVRCGGGKHTDLDDFVRVTRQKAQEIGRYPCRMCLRISQS